MKPNRAWAFAAALFLAVAPLTSRAASYSIVAAPGWNLIANQLDSPNGNNIRNVLVRPPVGSRLLHFNRTTKAFDPAETYQQTAAAGLTWVPGTNILNPGDGFYFFNPSADKIQLTFNGNPHIPVLPLTLGTGPNLLARQTNATAKVEDILGAAPPSSTVVYRFIPGAGHDPNLFITDNYTIYALRGNAWVTPPGVPPAFDVGEAVWINTKGALPTIERPPAGQAVCLSNKVAFAVGASGTPPLAYQWFLNGKEIPNATNASLSLPVVTTADAGAYTVQVSNPLGSVTSAPAPLVVGDKEPPTLSCPSNIVVSCRGPNGTPVTFKVGISDNCDPSPKLVTTPPSGSTFPGGVTTVRSTGTDASGNTNVCTFTVTVLDDIPPQISCPGDQLAAATSEKGAVVTFAPTATDNCDPSPKVACEPPSGSTFAPGATEVVCKAADETGNSSSCRFTVLVTDPSCCDAKSWRIADVQGPGARFGHSMAYDSRRARVVLFGGLGPNGLLGDTWEWDGTTWTQQKVEGPASRANAAMTFDRRINRVVLHGGAGAAATGTQTVFDDTWLWDGVVWKQVTEKSVGGRFSHAMAYDSDRAVSVLYGGVDPTGTDRDDTWEFDGNGWKKVAAGSPGPGPRRGHAMAYGSAQKQLLLYGGRTKETDFGDTWQWTGKEWKLLSKEGPGPRAFHAMAYSDTCDRVVLFGGGINNTFSLDDTWEWDGEKWALAATKLPTPRGRTAMAHDSSHGQTVLVAGTPDNKQLLGDTWLYSVDVAPPKLLSVDATCGELLISLTFDKPLAPASVEDPGHYSLVCGGTAVAITQVVLTADPRIVWIFVAQPVQGGCLLVIQSLQDQCGGNLKLFRTQFECRPDPCVRGSAGMEYWLTFPGNYAPDPAHPPVPQLFIAGAVGTSGTVSIPGAVPPFSAGFAIPPDGIARVTLVRAADLGDANDTVRTNGVHVLASRPVVVYGLNHVPFSTDGYLGLSTRALGQSYMIMAYRNVFTGVPELNGSQFALVATTDNTKVQVAPSVTVGPHVAGVPYPVTLMQGQTYQLRATNGAPADLTGTIITSDHPIAVFSGHRGANVPSTNVFFADHLVEQLPPTDLWGLTFLTTPLATRAKPDTFRVLALQDGTTVTTNGVAVPGPINRGKFVEFPLASASQVVASKPVLLAQFANSSDFDGVPLSDPFMVVVPPVVQYSSSYIVPAPSADFPTNYLNLVVPVAAVSQVVLDGASVPAAAFTTLGGSGFATAQVKVTVGAHTVTTSSGVNFGLVAYGWSLYDAYGFPGQTCGASVQTPPRFTCPPGEMTIQATNGCLALVPDLRGLVGNGSQALLITQEPPPGTPVSPGTFPVKVIIIDALGQEKDCTTVLTVRPGAAGLQCPQNILTNCNANGGQIVFYDVVVCNTNSTVTATPPSGSFFKAGTTEVIVIAKNAAGQEERCRFLVTVNCSGPQVGIGRTGSTLTLDWTGSALLQEATSIIGPWRTLSNAVPPFQARATNTASFYRLAP